MHPKLKDKWRGYEEENRLAEWRSLDRGIELGGKKGLDDQLKFALHGTVDSQWIHRSSK